VKVNGLGKMKGYGILVLTSARMVVINSKNLAKSDFKAFDIPLALTFKEKFNQPVFGANYLSGNCKPLHNLIPSDAEFKIWFMEGGCSKFLQGFRLTIKAIRAHSSHQGPPQDLINTFQSSSFQQQIAYVDPNDPTTLYVSQPPVHNAQSQMAQ